MLIEKTVPYEKQDADSSKRMCGAAALCMIYRSFGIACSKTDVWEKIAKRDGKGSWCARSYLLGQDAISRGLASLVVQTIDPWRALTRCHEHGIRVILNHRLNKRSPAGHYTVLIDIADDHAVVHDPHFGPERRLSQAELLELWTPGEARCEIAGNVLVAIADTRAAIACAMCHVSPPPAVACPTCKKEIPLQPAEVLGCVGPACPARIWKAIFCPHCDARLTRLEERIPARRASEGDSDSPNAPARDSLC